jgi:hypothetical protein
MGTSGSAGPTGWSAILVLLAIGLLAAACNSGSGTAASTITSRGAVTTTSPSAPATSTTGPGGQRAAAGTSPYYEVKTGTVSGLGTVLVRLAALPLGRRRRARPGHRPGHQRFGRVLVRAFTQGWSHQSEAKVGHAGARK